MKHHLPDLRDDLLGAAPSCVLPRGFARPSLLATVLFDTTS